MEVSTASDLVYVPQPRWERGRRCRNWQCCSRNCTNIAVLFFSVRVGRWFCLLINCNVTPWDFFFNNELHEIFMLIITKKFYFNTAIFTYLCIIFGHGIVASNHMASKSNPSDYLVAVFWFKLPFFNCWDCL